ncbi:Eco47II family restriction endonuclease [Clostridium bornimense]|uniref:Eco47II family restriction endonuclease n=1 Tax=Clostridium bornimense TaxID=1216932 RepID=UPI001C1029ED|nr:Eco47II family restriction endonuclease [Clostridium bornimense]MBU5316914.1 Eco47II family restriction endonuclease [Clostridium bornimense]
MALLTFMSDKHLYSCIYRLYLAYMRAKRDLDLTDLYKNKLDPIKAYFDMEFNEINLEEFIDIEAKRKADKSINNHIGDFHQELLNGIEGFEAPQYAGYDVRKVDNTIFGELKNKHNTMNSSSTESTFQKLQRYANEYPNSICYLIEVVATHSQDILWTPTCSGRQYSHPRVRRISIDKFYEVATGRVNAFKELCDAIRIATPQIIKYIKEIENKEVTSSITTNKAYEELVSRSQSFGISELDTIFKDNLTRYNGF